MTQKIIPLGKMSKKTAGCSPSGKAWKLERRGPGHENPRERKTVQKMQGNGKAAANESFI